VKDRIIPETTGRVAQRIQVELSRVPLDKSEGVVKTEISWAVREHRFFAREG